MWDLVVIASVPSVSSSKMCSEFVVLLCLLQSFCHALSYGVNHNATATRWFSHLHPLPAASPGVQYHRGLGLFGGWPPYTIQWVEPQGWGHLRANPGFGEFWFIPSLMMVAYLPPTSFIGRNFFGLFGVGLIWVQLG